MVASTILDDMLSATWALLHCFTEQHFHIRIARLSVFTSNPLMLASKAHHCLMTSVTQPKASAYWTINLHFSWV
jgi:hypothetical protein